MLIITEEPAGGLFRFLLGKVVDVRLLREQRGDGAAVAFQPIFRAERPAVVSHQRRFDAEHRVGLFFSEMRHRLDKVRRQLTADIFGQMLYFIVERAVAELEFVINNEVLHLLHFERHPDGDADGPDRQELDDPLDADRPIGPEAFQRRQADHLRPVKEELPRAAFAGIDVELRHWLSKQFAHRLALHVIGDIKREDINHFARVAFGLGKRSFAFHWFRLVRGRNHNRHNIPQRRRKVEIRQAASSSN